MLSRLCLLLAAVVCSASMALAADSRPNILWIVLEDQDPLYGCYGDAINVGQTPNVDGLADRGVRFDRAYVACPVCSPCRSSLMTGGMQTTLGIHNHRSSRDTNKVPEAAIHLPEGVKTLPELFREAGYETFNEGKDDYNFMYKRGDLYSIQLPKKQKANRYSPWREAKSDAPFFGQIQLIGGKYTHLRKRLKEHPVVDPESVEVPPYHADIPIMREQFAVQEESGRYADQEAGEILSRLKEDGLLDNTVVFYFSDHGMPTSVRHKQFCYEQGVRVPLIIAGPGIPEGVVNNDLVSGLDISATTVALAGMKQPGWFEGQNLFGDSYKPREFVIGARDRCDYTIDRIRTVRTDRFRYIKNFLTDRPYMQPQYRDNFDFVQAEREYYEAGKMNEDQARFWSDERPSEELYDMEADPYQLNNLADDPAYAAELKKHRDILNRWITETDDKGQYPEDPAGLLAVMALWGNHCVNPEYEKVQEQFKAGVKAGKFKPRNKK
ncbi:sulfatase family protein [Calycomorphotria hydatis]|uniref:Choline-sulfatase n=1 Tax=Calycomorphotria hydatis TaxID=2528027 RepID=A0A517T3A3_9PLAN|nr:sulfatase [Calycomorphotria hydatis]QDT62846.1 Choline-sulfatase [Calycomorphotria hydatis]